MIDIRYEALDLLARSTNPVDHRIDNHRDYAGVGEAEVMVTPPGARSVGWQSEAHADTALQSLQALLQAGASPPIVTACGESTLFEDVASYCDSFSQWWRKTHIAP